MDSTNREIEQKVLADPVADPPKPPVSKDEENATPPASDSPADKESELTFDTGFISWLQVVGSFFLFFNSWYAARKFDIRIH